MAYTETIMFMCVRTCLTSPFEYVQWDESCFMGPNHISRNIVISAPAKNVGGSKSPPKALFGAFAKQNFIVVHPQKAFRCRVAFLSFGFHWIF